MATDPGRQAERRQVWIGSVCAALAALGFAAKAILIKKAYQLAPVDSTTVLALRVLVSLPAFLVMAWLAKGEKLSGRDWAILVWLGANGYYLASFFDFWGLQYITAALERVILFTYPGIVLLLNAVWFGKKVKPVEFAALGLAWLGIGFVFYTDLMHSEQPAGVMKGALLVLGSAVTYAIYLVGSAKIVGRIGSARLTGIVVSVAAGFISMHFLLTHPVQDLVQPPPIYGVALALAVFSTVLPIFLTSEALRRIGANRMAIVGSVGPVLTIWLGYWILGEPVTGVQLAGTGLVLLGVGLVSRG
ncbi:MAG: DMT family transporter [Bryobacter sp.]|nr:DMT family transporter [Bryobacter sp.]